MKGVLFAPGIFVPAGKTLTIRGSGSLTVKGGTGAAAIGGAEGEACGNIIIEGGTVTATGGNYAAGIGSGKNGMCGNITIAATIASVTAIAGTNASPCGLGENSICGSINIADGLDDETINGTRTISDPVLYDLWLGGKQVTAKNRHNILGDGTASYDPETQTLTLDHPNITTTKEGAVIYSEGINLKVKGYYKMTEPLGSLGVSVTNGTLTMEGDFTFRGSSIGVYTNDNLSVKGTLRAYGASPVSCLGSNPTLEQGFFGETRVEGNDNLLYSVAGYASGDGTAEHPFEISNSTQWRKACADVANGCATAGKHFRIISSFYATATMGTADNPFAGTIDGLRQYFTLTASINEDKNAACTALFPYVSGATIKNLLLKGDIIGGEGSAGLVGKALGGTTTLENCVFDGTVSAVDSQTAANWIVGAKADGATVTTTNCLDVSLKLWGDVSRAYSVSGGNGVSIVQSGTTGVTYNGAIWAPKDAVVSFTASGGNGAYAPTCGGALGYEAGVYSLTVPEENVAIVPNDAVTYTITSPGDITGGNVHTNKTEASAGSPVRISVTRADYYLLKSLTVKDADDNEIEYDEYGFFRMPASAVSITAEFVKKYTFDATTGVLTLKYGTFNMLGTNGIGLDVAKSEVTKITADYGVRFNDDCDLLFNGFTNCTEIDLHNVETSALESTAMMFFQCSNLKKLNMCGWNTANVINMNDMFYGCNGLGVLDLSSFSFDAVTNANGMFDGCGVYMLTLPAGVDVTKEMQLNKGHHDNNWVYSGWQKLGDASVVSEESEVVYDSNNNPFTYAELPAQTEASTFVWKEMPDDFVLVLPDGQDNRALIDLWDGMTVNVKLTGRTLYHDGDWNTLCLPFTLSNSTDYPALLGAEFRKLDVAGKYNDQGEEYYGGDEQDIADYTIQSGFDEATGTLRLFFNEPEAFEPATPLLAKWDYGEDVVSPTFQKVTITNTLNNATSLDGKVQFLGSYDYRYFPVAEKSILFMGTSNTLYYPGNGASIGPNRSYFKLNLNGSANVREFHLNFVDGGDADGLTPIPSPVGEGSWYDLNGRKLSGKPTQKGIYINNGRRVVVK